MGACLPCPGAAQLWPLFSNPVCSSLHVPCTPRCGAPSLANSLGSLGSKLDVLERATSMGRSTKLGQCLDASHRQVPPSCLPRRACSHAIGCACSGLWTGWLQRLHLGLASKIGVVWPPRAVHGPHRGRARPVPPPRVHCTPVQLDCSAKHDSAVASSA